jgi:hypothetical protein
MTTRRVLVWDKPYEIEVAKVSKTRWTASGRYLGHWVTTKDASPGAAAKRWVEHAKTTEELLSTPEAQRKRDPDL